VDSNARIATARKADAAERSDRAKSVAKAGNSVLQNSANAAEVQARASIIMPSLALGL